MILVVALNPALDATHQVPGVDWAASIFPPWPRAQPAPRPPGNRPENVWIGVSIENGAQLSRVTALRNVPASVRFYPVLTSGRQTRLQWSVLWLALDSTSG